MVTACPQTGSGIKRFAEGGGGRRNLRDGRGGVRVSVGAASRQGLRHFPLSAGEALSRGRAPAGIGVQLRGCPGFAGAGNVISSNGLEVCRGESPLRSASKGGEHTVQPNLFPRQPYKRGEPRRPPQRARMLGGETGPLATLPASCCLTGRKGGRQAEPERQRATLGPHHETWQEPRGSERARGAKSPGWRRG